uniref:U4-ctenitoxin-Pr1a n=1 Tax=Phoneutria reidyi TaxID=272752 RepID=TX27_PHORI|nr:RecName: Full=U4-ctenitoxin-Pr1a; Short=U4-CNTX-Pr1a; AltName: Full=Neurotoxin PRTx27C3 [Phoneutria reidyi]
IACAPRGLLCFRDKECCKGLTCKGRFVNTWPTFCLV